MNSDIFFKLAITVAMILMVAFFSVYILILFQKRKVRLLKKQQEMQIEHEKDVLEKQVEMRDLTMKDVGRELHDNIGQMLTVIKLNMNMILAQPLEDKVAEKINYTKDLVGDVISDVRLLSKTLNGELVKQKGLLESIKHEINRINKIGVMHCHLTITGKPFPLPEDKEFVVFRIIQENLNNILKHAQCKNVYTELNYQSPLFTLQQQDDGVGYDIDALNDRNLEQMGSGLMNMYRRAELIKARFELSSQPGKGTRLYLEIENGSE